MSLEFKQTGADSDKNKLEQGMHRKGENPGAIVYQERLLDFETTFRPFLNDTFGNAMNQNVTFGGSPELIFDGGTGGTEWTGSIGTGAWNFADAGKVTITNADNLDNATWDDAGTIDMASHTAITGKIDLDTYNSVTNSILVQFGLAGVPSGNSVNLNDYIDVGNFAEQSFVIPKADLGLDGLTVDEMTITIIRTGGSKPDVKFDDFQIENTGTPAVFKLEPAKGTRYHVDEIILSFADNVGSTVSAGTMTGLDYNAILGVSKLTNGIVFRRTRTSGIVISATIKAIGDSLKAGGVLKSPISNGIRTCFNISTKFDELLILDSREDDEITFTINDDLSGLEVFSAFAKGKEETI